jgi:hypothetical protein
MLERTAIQHTCSLAEDRQNAYIIVVGNSEKDMKVEVC